MGGVGSGAIIRDGDRKSWDARGPIIRDNFSIFRTNCVILTSYFRANPRTCRGFSRGSCHVSRDQKLRVARFSRFSQRWQGIRDRALLRTFMLVVNGN